MRILILPVFNYPSNLEADSIFNICLGMARAWARSGRAHVYLALPDPRYRETEYFSFGNFDPKAYKEPGLTPVPIRMAGRYDYEELNLDVPVLMRFHPWFCDLPVDAVICTSAIKALMVRRLFNWHEGLIRPIIVSWDLLLRSSDSKEVAAVHLTELLMQAAGHATTTTYFQSPFCKRLAQADAGRHLKPSILGQSRVIEAPILHSGFDSGFLSTLEARPAPRPMRFIYRGRFTPSKRAQDILDIYLNVKATGRDVDVVVTTGGTTRAMQEILDANPSVRVEKIERREDSMDWLGRVHASLMLSDHELFCVSLWEMIAAGVIVVVLDADWHRGTLPGNYPWVVATEKDAFGALCEIYDNYPKHFAEFQKFATWARETYAFKATAPKFFDALARDAGQIRRKARLWVVEMLRKAPPRLTMQEALEFIADNAEQGEAALSFYAGTSYRFGKTLFTQHLVDCLMYLGYRDDFSKATPVWTKTAAENDGDFDVTDFKNRGTKED